MFRLLGIAVCRAWPIWLIAWAVVYAVLHLYAPAWEDIAQDREFGFLPSDMPTRQGDDLFRRAFPDEKHESNVVIVLSRAMSPLTDADRKFVREVIKPALYGLARKEGGFADKMPHKAGKLPIVATIRMFDDAGYGQLLVSNNGKAMLVDIELTTELLEYRNWEFVAKVESLIADWRAAKQVPEGLELSLIGSATVGRDLTVGQVKSAEATAFWTVCIVIVILLLLYRAPFLAAIPLLSVFVATRISLNLLSLLAQAGYVTLFEGVEIYVTIILYGTGVDYCLFLIARYKEERLGGADWGDAMAQALRHVGPALTASAATVIFGIGMMVFARFGKFTTRASRWASAWR
ncbi:MAG TPA: MMPL family transporter [Gemmataceae bacterium]|nr:MMPL family transporter [Gemmataceae bacterium]